MEKGNESGEEERMNNIIIRNALLDSTVAQLQEQYNCKLASCESVYRELASSNNIADNLKSQLVELELRQKKSLENIDGLKNQVGLLRSLDQSLSQQLQTIKNETQEIVTNQQGLLDKYSAKWEQYKEKYESLPWRIELRKTEVENKRLNIELKISKMNLIDKENKATLLYKIKCRREQMAVISFATACVNLSKSMKTKEENQQKIKDLEDENNNLNETKRKLLEELSLRTKSNIDKIKHKRDLQVLHDHRPADKLAPSQSLENKERLQLFKFNFQSKPSGDKREESGASHPLKSGFLPGLPDCLKNLFSTPSQPLSVQSTPRNRDAAEKPADKTAEREALPANQNLTSNSQQRNRSASNTTSSNIMAPPENIETVNHKKNLPSKDNQTNDNTSQKAGDILSKRSAENVINETPIRSTSVENNSQPQKSLQEMRSKKTLKRSSNFSALKNTSELILTQNNTSSANKESSAKNISEPIHEAMDTDDKEATVTINKLLDKSHPTSLPSTKDDNRSKQSVVNKDNQKVDANSGRGNQNISQSDNESVTKELQLGDNLKVNISKEQKIIVSPPDIFKRPSPVIVTSRSNQSALKVKGSPTQMNKRVKFSAWEEPIPQCSQDMFSQDSGFSTSQESMDSGDVSQHSHTASLDVGLKVDGSDVRFRNENESSQGHTDKSRVPIDRPSFSGFQKTSFKMSPDGQSSPTGGIRGRQGSRFSPNPSISPIMHGNDKPYENNKSSSNIRPPATSTPNFPQFMMSPVKSPELHDQQSSNSDDMTPMFNFEAASNVLSPLAPGQSFLNFEANTGECEAFNLFGTNESAEPEGSNIASNFFNFF